MQIRHHRKILWSAVLLIAVFIFHVPVSYAATLQDLKDQIQQKADQIKKLEEEAKQYKNEITTRQQRGQTLKQELGRIDQNIKQTKRDFVITQQKIQKTQLEIQQLSMDIQDKEASMERLSSGLASMMRSLSDDDQKSIVAIMLTHATLSDFFSHIDSSERLNAKILGTLDEVKTIKKELEVRHGQAQEKKVEAENLKTELQARSSELVTEKSDRTTLLTDTKNQEQVYQQLLHDREAKISALQKDIHDIESQINVAIDPSSLPNKGNGVLGWPLEDVSLESCTASLTAAKNCITQFFGYTAFARTGAYGQKGHNGTDFRASVGSSVLAAEAGEIQATGDRDIGCRGASYGRWILIRHSDNLSTLYGHLSVISVSPGQSVARGQFIGLSGSTGYATGPHLHFGVFVSKAVEVRTIISKVCGRPMTVPAVGSDPISGLDGYLNPMDYL